MRSFQRKIANFFCSTHHCRHPSSCQRPRTPHIHSHLIPCGAQQLYRMLLCGNLDKKICVSQNASKGNYLRACLSKYTQLWWKDPLRDSSYRLTTPSKEGGSEQKHCYGLILGSRLTKSMIDRCFMIVLGKHWEQPTKSHAQSGFLFNAFCHTSAPFVRGMSFGVDRLD